MSDALSRIELLLSNDRYADAQRLLGPALASDPNNPLLWSCAARVSLGLEEWQAALDAAGRVVTLMPDVAVGHLYASIAFAGLQRHRESLDAALQAVRMDPDHPTYHLQVAECASQVKGQRQLAWSAANRAVELAPDDSRSHSGMGLVALRQGRRDVAEQALRHALLLDPGNHAAQHNLGLVRLQSGEMAAAARDLQVSAAADPTSDLSHRAFHVLIMRGLQRLHWGLWGTWVAVRITSIFVTGPGPSIPVLVVLALCLAAVGTWVYRILRDVDTHLRFVLWSVLRRSATASGWFACVMLALVFLVIAALVPSEQFRWSATTFAAWALLVGCIVSWMEVGLSWRRGR